MSSCGVTWMPANMPSCINTPLASKPVECRKKITSKNLRHQADRVSTPPATEALPYVLVRHKGQTWCLFVMSAETHSLLAMDLDAHAFRHIEDGDLLD